MWISRIHLLIFSDDKNIFVLDLCSGAGTKVLESTSLTKSNLRTMVSSSKERRLLKFPKIVDGTGNTIRIRLDASDAKSKNILVLNPRECMVCNVSFVFLSFRISLTFVLFHARQGLSHELEHLCCKRKKKGIWTMMIFRRLKCVGPTEAGL